MNFIRTTMLAATIAYFGVAFGGVLTSFKPEIAACDTKIRALLTEIVRSQCEVQSLKTGTMPIVGPLFARRALNKDLPKVEALYKEACKAFDDMGFQADAQQLQGLAQAVTQARNLLNSPVLVPPATYDPCIDKIKAYDQMLRDMEDRLLAHGYKASEQVYHEDVSAIARLADWTPNVLQREQFFAQIRENARIVYHPAYNLKWGSLIAHFHPFDPTKYGKIYAGLTKDVADIQTIKPQHDVSDTDLTLVHSQAYIDELKTPLGAAKIAELWPLAIAPKAFINNVLNPIYRYATQGTIDGVEYAIQDPSRHVFNLGGGQHHAKTDSFVIGGFCFVNDTCISLLKHADYLKNKKVLIIDLDAHQGNGNEEVCIVKADEFARNNTTVEIFDVYNKDTWPGDFNVQSRINYSFPIPHTISDTAYLTIIAQQLPEVLQKSKPDLIIYNAGTDPLAGDEIGALNISHGAMVKRDELVFKAAMQHNVPVVMLLSGGYSHESGALIEESIKNILINVFGFVRK